MAATTYDFAYALARKAQANRIAIKPKYGNEIFLGPNGVQYPMTWDHYIGQERAKTQLRVGIASAHKRNARLDHTLIASGTPGIGKTALALLSAFYLGVGVVEVSGAMEIKDAVQVIKFMQEHDVLFVDEIHRMVAGGKGKAEWLLHLLQDGVLMTPTGPMVVPDITVIGATTDVGLLPPTITSRFLIKPQLVDYTENEAVTIAQGMAGRFGFGDTLPLPASDEWLRRVVRATNHNPRDMQQLLIAIRDIGLATNAGNFDGATYDLATPLEWTGLTADGLTKAAQDYLVVLAAVFDGTAGEKVMASTLNEPGGVRHTERLLIGKGLLMLSAKGRALTESGWARANELAADAAE